MLWLKFSSRLEVGTAIAEAWRACKPPRGDREIHLLFDITLERLEAIRIAICTSVLPTMAIHLLRCAWKEEMPVALEQNSVIDKDHCYGAPGAEGRWRHCADSSKHPSYSPTHVDTTS